jgi:hypothetical protein
MIWLDLGNQTRQALRGRHCVRFCAPILKGPLLAYSLVLGEYRNPLTYRRLYVRNIKVLTRVRFVILAA